MGSLYLATILVGSLFLIGSVDAGKSFRGWGYLAYNFVIPRQNNYDLIMITFQTTKMNGIIFYSVSSTGNYILIELYHGKIRYTAIYSTPTGNTQKQEGWIGMGLADNLPHALEVFRTSSDVMLALDRGTPIEKLQYLVVTDTHATLFADMAYIGGYPMAVRLPRMLTWAHSSFEGCIEYAFWNKINLLSAQISIQVDPVCSESPFYPITFPTPDAYFEVFRRPFTNGLTASFKFMTFVNSTTILYDEYASAKTNLSLAGGYLTISLEYNGMRIVDLMHPTPYLNNGSWHEVYLRVPGINDPNPKVLLSVDKVMTRTICPSSFEVSFTFRIGGRGFVGCLQDIQIDKENVFPYAIVAQKGIVENGCNLTDFCTPNPCLHNGYCDLNLEGFTCICTHTNYTGDACERPLFNRTCSEYYARQYKTEGPIMLDIDGFGPWDRVEGICSNMASSFIAEDATTVIQSSKEISQGKMLISESLVVYNVTYPGLEPNQLKDLVLMSEVCTQDVKYSCRMSSLFQGPKNQTMLRWLGGDGLQHQYWSSSGRDRACDCADTGQCTSCLCDVKDNIQKTDSAKLMIKDHLPVLRLDVGDVIGSKGSQALIQIGDLRCRGFGGRNLAITFQESFAYISLPGWSVYDGGEINFEFRSGRKRGVILYSRSRLESDYVRMDFLSETVIRMIFNLGDEDYTMLVDIAPTRRTIDDIDFHFVTFKINRLYAYFEVNGIYSNLTLPYATAAIRLNLDNMPLYLGGSPYELFNGFVGCIRNMFINGKVINLPQYAQYGKLKSTGVWPGCGSACLMVTNPCNDGFCIDYFNNYRCNCTVTAFSGNNCEEERAAEFRKPSSRITYAFKDTLIIEEMIISTAFRTSATTAVLFHLYGEDSVFIMLSLEAGVLNLYLNFEQGVSNKLNTLSVKNPGGSFNDDRRHIVRIWQRFLTVTMTVDGKNYTMNLPQTASQSRVFRYPKSWIVGSMQVFGSFSQLPQSGFIGCLSGMKLLYREKGKTFVDSQMIDAVGGFLSNLPSITSMDVIQGKCGDPFPVPQILPLLGTPPNPVPGGEGRASARVPLGNTVAPIVVGIAVFFLFVIALGTVMIVRYIKRNRGLYVTNEDDYRKMTEHVSAPSAVAPTMALPSGQQDWFI